MCLLLFNEFLSIARFWLHQVANSGCIITYYFFQYVFWDIFLAFFDEKCYNKRASKPKTPIIRGFVVAAELGFEPRQTESESVVLLIA